MVQDGNYPDCGVNETTALEASNSDVLAKDLKKIEETNKITVLQFESRFASVECGAGFQRELHLASTPTTFPGMFPPSSTRGTSFLFLGRLRHFQGAAVRRAARTLEGRRSHECERGTHECVRHK